MKFLLLFISFNIFAFQQGEIITSEGMNQYFQRIKTIINNKSLDISFQEVNDNAIISNNVINNIKILDNKFPGFSINNIPQAGDAISASFFNNVETDITNFMTSIFHNCKEILENNFSHGDGQYTIKPDGVNEVVVYCNMSFEGGGWTLFARQKNSGYWNIGDPNMSRTANVGTYRADYLSNNNFFRHRNDICPSNTEILFSTGDFNYWLITTESAFDHTYANQAQYIVKSSSSQVHTSYKWYNRGSSNPEDPWIGVGNHSANILWGESNYNAYLTLKNNHNGISVFCR